MHIIKAAYTKRTVNQISLSKLWYIGQIYTITKFIKNDIENTIVQLFIQKCGLSILDINTQLNSLEHKWIQRLLNSTNALGKGLMLYRLNLKLNFNQDDLSLFRQKRIHKTLQNLNNEDFLENVTEFIE